MAATDPPSAEQRPARPKSVVAGELFRETGVFAVYVWRRFVHDRCPSVAASLTYTTLLALVPLLTIGFAVLAAFPVFDSVREQIRGFAFENFVPSAGAAVSEQFTRFLANTGQLTAVGTVALAVTALMLLNTLEGTFNAVWRVATPRRLIPRLLTYWALLTLTPLLMGTSVALSGYIFTLTRMLGVEAFAGPAGGVVRVLPLLLLIAGFTLLYVVIPNRRVAWRHAFIGGLLAALLFEGLKRGFGAYVSHFPAYQTIYGALSAVPLFLVWMYVAWSVILFGAEVAASLPEWRGELRRRHVREVTPGMRLTLALGILAALLEARRVGEGRDDDALSAALEAEPEHVTPLVRTLAEAGYLARTADDTWMLARDLDRITLFDLHRTLGLNAAVEAAETTQGAQGWRRRAARVFERVEAAERELMAQDLRSLLDDTADEGTPAVGTRAAVRAVPGGEAS